MMMVVEGSDFVMVVVDAVRDVVHDSYGEMSDHGQRLCPYITTSFGMGECMGFSSK